MADSEDNRAGKKTRARPPDELPTLRFRARVVTHKAQTGSWSWIDIPERVSRALAPWRKAGHVRIDATLNDTAVQGSLSPRGGGRQMFILNASVRREAGIKPGDTVRVALAPRVNDAVRVPDDLAARLAALGGRAIFDAMSSSHRWEIVRYVTQTSTSSARARAVERIVDHVLGRAPADTGATPRRAPTGWYCPACGRRFSRPDAEHPCEPVSLDVVFEKKPAVVRAIFDAVCQHMSSLGDATVAVHKDSVSFVARRRFMYAVPRRSWLELRLLLARRVEHPRVKVFTMGPAQHINAVRLASMADLDDEVRSLLRESLAYGLPASVDPRPPSGRDGEPANGWERDVDEGFFEGLDEA